MSEAQGQLAALVETVLRQQLIQARVGEAVLVVIMAKVAVQVKVEMVLEALL